MSIAIHHSGFVPMEPVRDSGKAETASTAGTFNVDAPIVARLEKLGRAATVVQARLQEVGQAIYTNGLENGVRPEPMTADLLLARVDAAQRDVTLHAQALKGLVADIPPQVGAQSAGESHRDLFERIFGRIQGVQDSWVDLNQEALAKYLQFFQEFSRIMGGLKDAVSAGDSGKVRVNFMQLVTELWAFMARWPADAMGQFGSRAAAERFLTDAGLDPADFPITDMGGGVFGLGMPMASVQTIIDSMLPRPPALPVPISAEWDNATYQAWLSAKDSATEKLQHFSQVLGERFSRVTQLYDNLVKVLSATIESITDVDKNFLTSL